MLEDLKEHIGTVLLVAGVGLTGFWFFFKLYIGGTRRRADQAVTKADEVKEMVQKVDAKLGPLEGRMIERINKIEREITRELHEAVGSIKDQINENHKDTMNNYVRRQDCIELRRLNAHGGK